MNCLFELYDNIEGNIFLKGINIKDRDIRTIRNTISIIPQFGFLFAGNLKENIDPFNIFAELELSNLINSLNSEIR